MVHNRYKGYRSQHRNNFDLVTLVKEITVSMMTDFRFYTTVKYIPPRIDPSSTVDRMVLVNGNDFSAQSSVQSSVRVQSVQCTLCVA